MQISYGEIESGRAVVRNFILAQKRTRPSFRVLDIGGQAGGGWQEDIVDMTVDIAVAAGPKNMPMDICREPAWTPLLELVEARGKFDYIICTQTLEDIYNPITALELMPRIGLAGIITNPSVLTEMSRHDNPNWTGYPHHRWVFDQIDGGIYLAPKLAFTESVFGGAGLTFDRAVTEIKYEWVGEIKYKMFMDNYLCPPWDNLVSNYKDFLQQGIDNLTAAK